jgi:hypothetical protein
LLRVVFQNALSENSSTHERPAMGISEKRALDHTYELTSRRDDTLKQSGKQPPSDWRKPKKSFYAHVHINQRQYNTPTQDKNRPGNNLWSFFSTAGQRLRRDWCRI